MVKENIVIDRNGWQTAINYIGTSNPYKEYSGHWYNLTATDAKAYNITINQPLLMNQVQIADC